MAGRSLGPRGSRRCRGSCEASRGARGAAAGSPTRAARWSGRICRVGKATCAASLNRRPSFEEGAPPPQRTLDRSTVTASQVGSHGSQNDSAVGQGPRLLVRVSVVHFTGSLSASQKWPGRKLAAYELARTMTPAPAPDLRGQRAAPRANRWVSDRLDCRFGRNGAVSAAGSTVRPTAGRSQPRARRSLLGEGRSPEPAYPAFAYIAMRELCPRSTGSRKREQRVCGGQPRVPRELSARQNASTLVGRYSITISWPM
jgi:hypothetical protein